MCWKFGTVDLTSPSIFTDPNPRNPTEGKLEVTLRAGTISNLPENLSGVYVTVPPLSRSPSLVSWQREKILS